MHRLTGQKTKNSFYISSFRSKLLKLIKFSLSSSYSIYRAEDVSDSGVAKKTLLKRSVLKCAWLLLFPIRLLFTPLLRLWFVFDPWERVNKLRYNLTTLGFAEDAYIDLEQLAQSKHRRARLYASWNLAWWHANQLTKTDALKCLDNLEYYLENETEQTKRNRGLILRAESTVLAGLNKEDITAKIKKQLLTFGEDANLYLALASLESKMDDRLLYINKAIMLSGVVPVDLKKRGNSIYDRLTVSQGNLKTIEVPPLSKQPLVTVIIPAFNAAETIPTAIESIQNQTWQNVEIIVANDCSTDNTARVARHYAQKDNRIRVISTASNSGPYVARNEALKIARGEYITCNDSDDWSHPQKIQKQVEHLIENPKVVANTSELARTYDNLSFYRRGLPGMYTQINMSSLMFRRKTVADKLGYWDGVRFGADSEFIKRLRLVLGEHSVVELKNALYSFLRQSDGSLTGNKAFGYHGFMMGARKEYSDAQAHYHNHKGSLYYSSSLEERPFTVPYPMLPTRKKNIERTFDIVIAADMRTNSPEVKEVINLIDLYTGVGKSVAVTPIYKYMTNTYRSMNDNIRKILNEDEVKIVVYGESVRCERLIVLGAQNLKKVQKYVPNLKAKSGELDDPSSETTDFAKKHFSADAWKVFNGN